MGALAADQAQLALIIAEEDEVFAHQTDGGDRAFALQLNRQGGRLPVAAENFARAVFRAYPRDQVVDFLAKHRRPPPKLSLASMKDGVCRYRAGFQAFTQGWRIGFVCRRDARHTIVRVNW